MRALAHLSTVASLCVSACAALAAGPAQPPPAAPAGFDGTFQLQGVTFRVTCPNASSMNEMTLVTSGLVGAKGPITQEVDGIVTGAAVADVNSDGLPEIYVFVQSVGSGSYGSLVAYSANGKRSLSPIHFPPVSENPRISKGYMGHDAFAIVENRFVQRFPVYRPGDTNASPSGGMRQVRYLLVPGEAGWVLKVDGVEDVTTSR
jgi:hypothetical protein